MSGVDPVTGINNADLDRHITEGPASAPAHSAYDFAEDPECMVCGRYVERGRDDHFCAKCREAADA